MDSLREEGISDNSCDGIRDGPFEYRHAGFLNNGEYHSLKTPHDDILLRPVMLK